MLEQCLCQQFFSRTAGLWNSLPTECFPLTYDLSDFKSRINRHLLTVSSFNRFPVSCNLFVLLFLVTPCLVVAVQPCREWIPIKKGRFIEMQSNLSRKKLHRIDQGSNFPWGSFSNRDNIRAPIQFRRESQQKMISPQEQNHPFSHQ